MIIIQMQISGEVLTGALSTLRSKGVSIYMAVQSIGQIRKKYGEDQAREIIDTCAYVSVMSAQDPESRKYFGNLGDRVAILANGKYIVADKCYWWK